MSNGAGDTASAAGDASGAAAANTHGRFARSWSEDGFCFDGAECSGPSIVQMTNGEALALEIAASIQPAGRSARRTIATRASCRAADLRAVLTSELSLKPTAVVNRAEVAAISAVDCSPDKAGRH